MVVFCLRNGKYEIANGMWFIIGTCRVFWYSFTRMGFGVHEGSVTGESKRQPSDNCAGMQCVFV